MNGILDWGLSVVHGVQTIANPVLTAFVLAFTQLGSEYFYLAALPLVYWCVDERKGFKLGVAVLLSAWINSFSKAAWKQPRPYDFDPQVGLAHENTFGLPSGHAQGTVVFWGIVAPWIRAPFGLLAALLLPLLIGFTRIYLGVHFPTDILLGWAFGGIVLAVYYVFGDLIEATLSAAPRQVKLIVAAAAAFCMNALYPADVSIGAVLFGMSAGYILMTEKFPFSASRAADGSKARLPALAARFALGALGIAVIYFGLKLAFPGDPSPQRNLFRFIRYGCVGAWVSAGAPWLFLRLKLAGSL